MKKLLLGIVALMSLLAYGQTPLANATLEITLTTVGGTQYRSAIAYNPNQQLYYSTNSGSSGYTMETYDATGNPVSTSVQGFDYRGCWWNPNTNQLEGNGYNTLGIWVQDLDASFYPVASGTNVLPSTSGPASQSCGDYDFDDDEILYYDAGSIYRHARATNLVQNSVAITGLPVATSNLNTTSACYTGITGMEVGVYDHVDKKFYFINKQTGAYMAECQLPLTAPAADYQKVGMENGLLFVYDGVDTWYGYKVIEQCTIDLTVTENGGDITAAQDSAQYQWIDCDNGMQEINGENGQTFSPSISGNYAVVINNGSCSDTSSCTFVDLTSLDEHKAIVNIYPNPTSNKVVIEGLNPTTVSAIEIRNLLGQSLNRLRHFENKIIIDLSEFPNGIYLIDIISEGHNSTYRIVKN